MLSNIELIAIVLVFVIVFSKNIGRIFYYNENWSIALFFFKLNPFYYTNKFNLIANCYAETGDNVKAIELYKLALKYEPNYEIYQNLGLSYSDIGLYDDAYICFKKSYHDKYIKNFDNKDSYTTKYKIKHDIEQIEYLIKQNILDTEFYKKIDSYKILEKNIDSSYDFYYYFDNNNEYDKNLYIYESNYQGNMINDKLDTQSIENKYINSEPQLIYFDDFLNTEALEEITKFCLLSTIWHEYDRKRGYIASYMSNGFNFKLIYKLAEELAKKFPLIFKNYTLRNVWAFKYMDNSEGVLIHADEAVINVNFWIIPDEANLNKDTGGMIVYNKEAPKSWDFKQYNTNTEYINKYIDDFKSDAYKINYKQNRVVIFNSSLFHQTDNFNFKSGYENHRINVTLLFGKK